MLPHPPPHPLAAQAAPFNVRGANYLKDRIKIPAGLSAFTLSAFDMVSLPYAVEHVGRFLPSIRWVWGAWGRAGLGWTSCITKLGWSSDGQMAEPPRRLSLDQFPQFPLPSTP